VDTKPRTEDDIKRDYFNACAQAGELQFEVERLTEALADLNSRIQALRDEAKDLPKPTPKEETNAQPQSEASPVAV
jgi:uncharacterized coiled-coil DUF342 family protein